MTRTIKPGFLYLSLALTLAAPLMGAQQAEANKQASPEKPKAAVAQAPVPAQIVTAKKVFIAYAGGETTYRPLGYSGGVDRTYAQFYAALKTWGHYELVSTPAEAELVFEVSFANPFSGESVSGGGGTGITPVHVSSTAHTDPQLRVSIIDVKTHITLWNVTEHVEFARLQGNRDKNFDLAMTALVNDIARLAGTPPAIVVPKKKDDVDQQD